LLELKGKLGADIGSRCDPVVNDAQADILQALLALGYSDKEAAAALKALPAKMWVSATASSWRCARWQSRAAAVRAVSFATDGNAGG
jgi:Holliday junction resolvasome RuvABC DNA-binding subunit